MALALILRNASKTQAGTLPQSFLKSSIVVTKNFSPLLCQQHHSTLTNQNNFCKNLNLSSLTNKVTILQQTRLMSGDHSKLWPIEKLLSFSLLGLVPAAVITPHYIVDNILAVATVAHFHWGLEAVVVDYVRPIIFGYILPKLTLLLLYVVSASTLGALIYYNLNDLGIGQTIKKFWAIPIVQREEPVELDKKGRPIKKKDGKKEVKK